MLRSQGAGGGATILKKVEALEEMTAFLQCDTAPRSDLIAN